MRDALLDIGTLFWKEWREHGRRLQALLYLGGLLAMWCVNLIVVATSVSRAFGTPGMQLVTDTVLSRFVFSMTLLGVFLCLPQIYLKERYAGTLESLLATPLQCHRLWLGKSLVLAAIGVGLGWVLAIVGLVILNILAPDDGTIILPSAPALVFLIVVLPAVVIALSLVVGAANLLQRRAALINSAVLLGGMLYLGWSSARATRIVFDWSSVAAYLLAAVALAIVAAIAGRYMNEERML